MQRSWGRSMPEVFEEWQGDRGGGRKEIVGKNFGEATGPQ